MSKYAPIWPTPPDDPADVSIKQLEGDVARLEERLERALAALQEIRDMPRHEHDEARGYEIARSVLAEAEK